MSAAAHLDPSPTLRYERGGLATPPPATPARMKPADIPLTLSADVLRLPYPLAARVVMAEIVSLYAANQGLCDASDAHFAARLSINKDTASEAVKKLVAEGLVKKVTSRTPAGLYRTLTPNYAAIAAKAATNSYPENPVKPTRKFRLGHPENPASQPGNSGEGYPEIPVEVPGNSGSNIPGNTPGESSTPHEAGAGEAEKKIGASPPEEVTPLAAPQRSASHTGGGAAGPAAPAPDLPHLTTPPPEPEEPAGFAPLWDCWPKQEKRPAALRAFRTLSADEQAAAASRADAWLSARPDLPHRDNGRYLPQLANWLSDKRWTDANPQPVSPQPHATQHPTSYPPRPVNGHKPGREGGAMARALAERSQQRRAGAGGD